MTNSAGSGCSPREPGSNRLADLRPGIFLDEVTAGHGYFRLIAPAAAEFTLVSDQNGAGIGIDKQLRDVILSHPTGVSGGQLGDRRGLPVDRDFARPGQGRPAILPGAREGTPVFRHFRGFEASQDRCRENALDKHVLVENHLLTGLGAKSLEYPPRAFRPLGPGERPDDRLHVDGACDPTAMVVGPIEAENRAPIVNNQYDRASGPMTASINPQRKSRWVP